MNGDCCPETTTRMGELYPELDQMFRTVGDQFAFTAYGRRVWVANYDQAYTLYVVGRDNKINAIRVLRTFIPSLNLKLAKDIVEFILENFKPKG